MILMLRFWKDGCSMKMIRQINRLLGSLSTLKRGCFSNLWVILLNSLSNSSLIACTGSWRSVPDGIEELGNLRGIISWNGQDISLVVVGQGSISPLAWQTINYLCQLIRTV